MAEEKRKTTKIEKRMRNELSSERKVDYNGNVLPGTPSSARNEASRRILRSMNDNDGIMLIRCKTRFLRVAGFFLID